MADATSRPRCYQSITIAFSETDLTIIVVGVPAKHSGTRSPLSSSAIQVASRLFVRDSACRTPWRSKLAEMLARECAHYQ